MPVKEGMTQLETLWHELKESAAKLIYIPDKPDEIVRFVDVFQQCFQYFSLEIQADNSRLVMAFPGLMEAIQITIQQQDWMLLFQLVMSDMAVLIEEMETD